MKRLNDWNELDALQLRVVIDAIRRLMAPAEPKKRKIGFLVEQRAATYGRR
jgi:hypothetical protein